jgi:hypothetical protein
LVAFVGLGLLATTSSVRAWSRGWTSAKRFDDTGSLYAPDAFEAEWRPILKAASTKKVLILSYGNGVREFFPQIQAPDSWFLLPGILKPPEKQKLLDQIRNADVVAEELQENTRLVDEDPDIQAALKPLSIGPSGEWFRVRIRVRSTR